MANTIILNFRFKDDNGSNDFSLTINTQITQTVACTVTGRHVTYNNFNLYRNDFAKDVKEHMKSSTGIRTYFSESPDINQVHVLIHPQ